MSRIVFDPAVPVEEESARACSVLSRMSCEPAAGTASAQRAWLLVEENSAWGPTAAAISRHVPEGFQTALEERDVRLQLIRRPGRRQAPTAGRTVALAWSERTGPWAQTLRLDDPWRELPVDALDALSTGTRPDVGTPIADAVVLVCTHGTVDPCCARFGRPVAARLAQAYGPMVWETTHVGGCRFAANVMILPHGVMYGRAQPDTVGHVAAVVELDRKGAR